MEYNQFAVMGGEAVNRQKLENYRVRVRGREGKKYTYKGSGGQKKEARPVTSIV